MFSKSGAKSVFKSKDNKSISTKSSIKDQADEDVEVEKEKFRIQADALKSKLKLPMIQDTVEVDSFLNPNLNKGVSSAGRNYMKLRKY